MSAVTGVTAERMLAIEAGSVVHVTVDSAGNIVFFRHDGSTIPAGNIKGPPGPEGPSAASTSLPTANTLVKRDADGRFEVVGPTVSTHAATKAYVDATVNTAISTERQTSVSELSTEAAKRGKILGVSTATGDSTASNTDVIDDKTAPITFTAVTGRYYTIEGIGQCLMSTGLDGVRALIRDSGSADVPTSTSTVLVACPVRITTTGTTGKTAVGGLKAVVRCPQDIAAGTHTVALFRNVFSGSGNVQLSSSVGPRKLVVQDNGAI